MNPIKKSRYTAPSRTVLTGNRAAVISKEFAEYMGTENDVGNIFVAVSNVIDSADRPGGTSKTESGP